MLPAHYLAVKAAMLRQAARRGVLPRSEARTMFRLDPSRALKVCTTFWRPSENIPCMLSSILEALALRGTRSLEKLKLCRQSGFCSLAHGNQGILHPSTSREFTPDIGLHDDVHSHDPAAS